LLTFIHVQYLFFILCCVFLQALGDDAAPEGEFEVTKEEMSILRAELACEFPDDYTYMR